MTGGAEKRTRAKGARETRRGGKERTACVEGKLSASFGGPLILPLLHLALELLIGDAQRRATIFVLQTREEAKAGWMIAAVVLRV